MNPSDLFETWAPPEALWSPWVKPVLFAWLRDHPTLAEMPELPPEWEFSWLPGPLEKGNVALVLDLPCAEGVAAGLALAAYGYRPVPLYNALPESHLPSLVRVQPIAIALQAATPRLAESALVSDAPPAFLLDSRRRKPSHESDEDEDCFDNRSVSFPTDFPSANFLLGHGIRRTILVQRESSGPAADLAHTLRAWQEAGIVVAVKEVEFGGPSSEYHVPKPLWFGAWFYRALEMIGFRRNLLGGFGGVLDGSSGGG